MHKKRGLKSVPPAGGGRTAISALVVFDLANFTSDPLKNRITGSSGVDPRPVSESNATWLSSFMGVVEVADECRVVSLWLLMPSTAARQRLSDLTMRGRATCLAQMRPRYGSSKYAGLWEEIAPSSV